jgi:hypothetical protein
VSSGRFFFITADFSEYPSVKGESIFTDRPGPKYRDWLSVADLELRLSLSDLSVERSFRETKARGDDTADPKNAGHWVLE